MIEAVTFKLTKNGLVIVLDDNLDFNTKSNFSFCKIPLFKTLFYNRFFVNVVSNGYYYYVLLNI